MAVAVAGRGRVRRRPPSPTTRKTTAPRRLSGSWQAIDPPASNSKHHSHPRAELLGPLGTPAARRRGSARRGEGASLHVTRLGTSWDPARGNRTIAGHDQITRRKQLGRPLSMLPVEKPARVQLSIPCAMAMDEDRRWRPPNRAYGDFTALDGSRSRRRPIARAENRHQISPTARGEAVLTSHTSPLAAAAKEASKRKRKSRGTPHGPLEFSIAFPRSRLPVGFLRLGTDRFPDRRRFTQVYHSICSCTGERHLHIIHVV